MESVYYLIPKCKECIFWMDGVSGDLGCGCIGECEYIQKQCVREYKHKLRMKTYMFEGPIYAFDGKILSNKWKGCTKAVSAKHALNNIKYQFKREQGLLPTYKVDLIKGTYILDKVKGEE